MNEKDEQSIAIDDNAGSLAITEYNATATALHLLREKYRELPDVATVEGMNVAKAGYPRRAQRTLGGAHGVNPFGSQAH